MKTNGISTFVANTIVLLACAQFIACSKSSDSSGRGSSAPAKAPAPTTTPDGQVPPSDQFEPGTGQAPQQNEPGLEDEDFENEEDQIQPDLTADPGPKKEVPDTAFQPSEPSIPNTLPPGPIPPGTGQGSGGKTPTTTTPSVVVGNNLTGLAYDQNQSFVGSGNDQLLAELKSRYASLPPKQFEKARERAANIARIRIGFNSVTNNIYAALTMIHGPKKVLEFSGTVNQGMQALQSQGPALSLNCTDNSCMTMVGRLDYADGTKTSFIYRNHDKKLVFDFLTNGSVTEQTYRNWIRLIDSQLEIDPNCAKISYREYASYEVAYGRSEAVLVIKTNFDEIVEISVPVVASKSSDDSQIRARGELRGLSGTPYLSYNILQTEIVSNSGQGNITMKITTGRSKVDQGEFLISVVEK
jgi:hypothetical protein